MRNRSIDRNTGKKMSSDDKLHLGIRLWPDDHKLLKEMANEDDRTMSNLIVVLIRKEARLRGLL